MTDINTIIVIGSGILSTGIVYGTVKSKLTQQDTRIENIEKHSDTIVEVKTKLDLIINHFLNKN
jgi:hypothetical protein